VTDRKDSKMIRTLRVALGLTKEQFEAKVEVSYSTINCWENNKTKTSFLAKLKSKQVQN